MTFKELGFFYKLCENPQVSQAAAELGISQSAVSLAIKSLENKLGESLFDRMGKKLILNERGRFFYEKTYPHFLALKDSKNLFLKNKIAGSIKVAASKTIANYLMPQIYYDFLSRFDQVRLTALSLNSAEIIKKVLDSKLDLGIIETECKEQNLEKIKLAEDELILITSDKSYKKECYIDEIDKRWIMRESGSGTRDVFMQALGEHAKSIKIFMELYDFEEIKKVLLHNKNTLTVTSKVSVKEELESEKLFEVRLKNIRFQREFYCIYRKDKAFTTLLETFVEFMRERFAAL